MSGRSPLIKVTGTICYEWSVYRRGLDGVCHSFTRVVAESWSHAVSQVGQKIEATGLLWSVDYSLTNYVYIDSRVVLRASDGQLYELEKTSIHSCPDHPTGM